jgi:FkbM family methyltransferase
MRYTRTGAVHARPSYNCGVSDASNSTTAAPEQGRTRTRKSDPRFEALCDEVRRLSVAERVRLFDVLTEDDVTTREDGLRFSVRSVTEFKRASKMKPADQPMADWIGSFGRGDVFFDIGANTGGLSLLAGVVHQGRVPVVAFEPAFDNFEALVRNVMANGLEATITPLQVALFDESGLRPFHYYRKGAGSALHAVGEPLDFLRRPFQAVAVQPVMALRLDDVVNWFALPRPTRIKLDVDGFEDKVLRGAEGVLTAGPCELVVEVVQRDEADHHAAEMLAYVRSLGFLEVSAVERRAPGAFPRAQDVLLRRE